MSVQQSINARGLERVPQRPAHKPVIVLKFGGTAVGATKEEGRIKRAREVIGEYLRNGYYVVPVFSAYRRGRSGSAEKVSITDELQGYRRTIQDAPSERRGEETFRQRIWSPHVGMIEDLLLTEDAQLQRKLEEEVERIVETAVISCRSHELVPSLEAYILTGGERLSTMILSAYFNRQYEADKFPWRSTPVSALKFGLVTDSNFKNANIKWERAVEHAREVLLGRYLDQEIVPIVTGFDGIYDPNDEFEQLKREDAPEEIEQRYTYVYRTCLGRGGSDLTATFLGMALGAEFVGFAKETNGVLTGDDMIVGDTAKTVPRLDYDLATEAGNIFSKAVQPVKTSKVPVHIFDPRNPSEYTEISDIQLPEALYLAPHPEKGFNVHISALPDEPGRLIRLLEYFAQYDIDVAEVRHHKSATDCIIRGEERAVDALVLDLDKAGYDPQLTYIWYVRVVGNITPTLAAQFNAYVDELHAHASASFQLGTKVLTATFNRNRIGSEDTELARVHNLVKRIHDDLVVPSLNAAESTKRQASPAEITTY